MKGRGVQPQPLVSACLDVGSDAREQAKLSADQAGVAIWALGGYALGSESPGNEVVMVVTIVGVVVLAQLA